MPLSKKFKNLLAWLGVSNQDVDKLRLETLKLGNDVKAVTRVALPIPKFETVELPPESRTLDQLSFWYKLDDESLLPKDLIDVVNYAMSRHLDMQKYTFAWSTATDVGLNRRLIIPFFHEGQIVGWTARSIDAKHKLKYYSHQPPNYVFNLDRQLHDRAFVIVCEGPVDALSLDAVATLGSTVNELQARQIKQLQRQVIVVPDRDSSGANLIDVALQNNWSVSFPDWWETCKDVNDAVVKYGRLFTLKNILDRTVTNPVKIELMRKKHFKNNKDN